jgi:hypothetical protein
MTDLADEIYEATGLTLNAEDTEAIGRMITQGRRDALEEAAKLVETHVYTVSNSEPQFRLTPSNHAKDDMHHTTIAAAIRALKGTV